MNRIQDLGDSTPLLFLQLIFRIGRIWREKVTKMKTLPTGSTLIKKKMKMKFQVLMLFSKIMIKLMVKLKTMKWKILFHLNLCPFKLNRKVTLNVTKKKDQRQKILFKV